METGTSARWFLRVSCVEPLAVVQVSMQDTVLAQVLLLTLSWFLPLIRRPVSSRRNLEKLDLQSWPALSKSSSNSRKADSSGRRRGPSRRNVVCRNWCIRWLRRERDGPRGRQTRIPDWFRGRAKRLRIIPIYWKLRRLVIFFI